MKTQHRGCLQPVAMLLLLWCGLSLAGCYIPVRPVDPPPDDDRQTDVKPDVQPVDPQPTVGPISVLIVEETSDRVRPEARTWVDIVDSPRVREYLDQHCAKDEAGNPRWRDWDQDKRLDDLDPFWREAMRLPRSSVPWIVISNGQAGVAGPLPQSEAETLKLLQKWGGE